MDDVIARSYLVVPAEIVCAFNCQKLINWQFAYGISILADTRFWGLGLKNPHPKQLLGRFSSF